MTTEANRSPRQKDTKDSKDNTLPINARIRAPRVQLINEEGVNIGVVDRNDALKMAEEASLDLVMIAEVGKDNVPIVKIMDFGKALYKKKKDQTKKKQTVIQVKEIKMSPKIGAHDYQTKIKQALEFLNQGKRVKVSLFFRGRELMTKEQRGAELFSKVDQSFADSGLAEQLVKEKDTAIGQVWSRVYYLK